MTSGVIVGISVTPTFRCRMLQVRSTTQVGTSPKPEPISARLALATEGADLRMKNCMNFSYWPTPHSGTKRGHLTFEYFLMGFVVANESKMTARSLFDLRESGLFAI